MKPLHIGLLLCCAHYVVSLILLFTFSIFLEFSFGIESVLIVVNQVFTEEFVLKKVVDHF